MFIPLTQGYEDDNDVDLRISPVVGLRLTHTRQVIEKVGGGREEIRLDTPTPMIGAGIDIAWDVNQLIPLIDRLDIAASTTFGPALSGDGGSAWQVRADLTLSMTPNIGLVFGYRLLEMNLEDNDYTFDAGLQGLFVGASLRF